MLFFLSSCEWKPSEQGDSKKIVCTTTMVGDAVKQLTGGKYQVVTLMGAGVDPHLYEAKPSDVRALGNARVIVYSGLHLEGKMSDLFERMRAEKEIIAFSNGMDPSKLIRLNAHTRDPHVWFDPILWLQGIRHCAEDLCRVFPDDSSFIMDNYSEYEAKVQELNNKLKIELSIIPHRQRVLITSHDAFHYFGKAFDVEVMALQGISTIAEPGLKDVSDLVNLIVRRKIKAIFIESSVSSKSIHAVIEGCKARGHSVKIGGTLYSDALGDKKSGANSYLGMMQKNVQTLVSGLTQ